MKQLLWIGLAGMFGAVLRTSIGIWLGEENTFPVATFSVNMIATWLLCFLAGGVPHTILKNEQLREALTIGFLGSFSTFSAFSMETVLLMKQGQIVLAIVYVFVSIIGGLSREC